MKRLILAVFGLSTLVGLAFYMSRPGPPPAPPAEPATESAPSQPNENPQPAGPVAAKTRQSRRVVDESVDSKQEPRAAVASTGARSADAAAFNYAIDALVSTQTGYEQKRAIWKQLRDAGKLDLAIAELERRAADDPRSAADQAALGQAYFQKCGAIQDVREQAILAMQADKVFDTALNLDPYNWDARFDKAAAMSHWPASLNKGQEVIDNFQILIQQQETEPPQPQFAKPYIRLGEQYQKAGNLDLANQVWQRGAALFPDNTELKGKLTAAPQPAP